MTYRERRARKAERYREWADKRDEKADAAETKSRAVTDNIPLGQPILTDHYSAKSHRNALTKAHNNMDKAIEHSDKANEFRSRADNIEAAADHAIYSDDDDAIERLRERIADLEAQRDRIKAYNATCRKGKPDYSLLTEDQKTTVLSTFRTYQHVDPNNPKDHQLPSFMLTNLSGNISRNKKRLAKLEAQ